jgi:hypothetical protein
MAGRAEARKYYGTTAVCLLPSSGRPEHESASRMNARRSWRNVR